MVSSRLIIGILSAAVTCAGVAFAQDFPNRPLRIVLGSVGGGNDLMARVIAQGIAGPLGQPVIVDNRASGGTVPVDVVAKSQPDGYTVLLYGSATWIAPLFRATTFDTIRDFSPVTLAERS